ncbi:MAG TPA: hypothetical protein VFT88_14130, partial [Acidobacteriaceae bacterium]|nr:hypothetical protein [Acidobacteriaceae bacterium]
MTEATGLGSYLEAFSEMRQRTSRQPQWLRTLREDAFGQFCDMGFPTLKDEAWRFTSVAPIARESFRLAEGGAAELTLEDLKPFLIPDSNCRLVFVNGRYAAELSDCGSLPAGVT